MIQAVFGQLDYAQCVGRLSAAQTAYGAINSVQDLIDHPQLRTRPVEVNGLGMSPAAAGESIRDLIDTYDLHRDEDQMFDLWLQLAITHAVKGKNGHDTRIVAAMQCHGLTNLVTFNVSDFARFADIINVYSPSDIVNGLLKA